MAARVACKATSKRLREASSSSSLRSARPVNPVDSSILEPVTLDDEVSEVFTQSNELLRLQQPAPDNANFTPKTCSTPKHNRDNNNESSDDAASPSSTSTSTTEDSELSPADSPPLISAFQAHTLPHNPHPVDDVEVLDSPQFRAPILGYEVIEQQDKFTAFKINVQRIATQDSWFVFRRYTDFARLHHKLTGLFPHIKLQLPPKRWFKDNFEPTFLEQRILGLQYFVNSVLENSAISQNAHVADFFCLNDPPSPNDNLQASRLRCECMETIISNLSLELKEKSMENEVLKAELALARAQKETLLKSLRLETSRPSTDQICTKLVHDRVSESPKQVSSIGLVVNETPQLTNAQRTVETSSSPSPTGSEVYKASSSVMQIVIDNSSLPKATDSNGNPTYLELHRIKPD